MRKCRKQQMKTDTGLMMGYFILFFYLKFQLNFILILYLQCQSWKSQRQKIYMRNNISSTRFLCQINPKNHNIQEFYDPLTPTQLVKKKPAPLKPSSCFRSLFDDEQNQENNFEADLPAKKGHDIFSMEDTIPEQKQEDFCEDSFLKRIITNAKHNQTKKIDPIALHSQQSQQPKFQPYSFDKKIQVKYPQTPHFKNQLLSPFWKFNRDNKYNIETLQKNFNNGSKNDFLPIDLDEDPLCYVTEPIKYFIGLALKMKEKDMHNQCLMFLKLGCYAQPYNDKGWKKYIQFVEQRGQMRKCLHLAKTAFLFCQTEQFAKMYIAYGEKCGTPLEQLRGVITNVSNADLFQKGLLVQIGKLWIKHKQSWKGIKILFELCIWNQFKLPVCTLINFLAKFLQNIGQTQKALTLLKKSFGKNMSKLQIYSFYLQIKNREQKGNIKQATIKEVLDYVESISSQNRYKLYLEVAEILFKQKNQKYKHFLEQAYFAAKNYCAQGTGCNKALKHIFFSVLRWKKVIYPFESLGINDLTIFQSNRQKYILGQPLQEYDFSDWKYYLHYGLQKRDDILNEASKKWPYTGRLIAEWIHCLRLKRPLCEVLRIWRQKIQEVPKSGELWCEGGRMYSELKDYENASKCFRAAIHFTPQYGDSFFEQLKILLIKGKFRQIYKLKKMMLVSQPFYGHVWSFLKSFQDSYRFSLSDIWQLAQEEIKAWLYQENSGTLRGCKPYCCETLTALQRYNESVLNPNSQQIRVRLFNSYQQIQNRN